MEGIETKYKKIFSSGKRKASVARAIITSGKGEIIYNKRALSTLDLFDRLKLEEPLRIYSQIIGNLDFDCKINARGGGEKGQIDAARLALAKGLVDFKNSEELRNAYLLYDRNLLVADVRRKETRKPGDSRARAKRQTSYR